MVSAPLYPSYPVLHSATPYKSGGRDTAVPVGSDAAAGDAPPSPPLRASSSTFCKNSMAPKTHAHCCSFSQAREHDTPLSRAHLGRLMGASRPLAYWCKVEWRARDCPQWRSMYPVISRSGTGDKMFFFLFAAGSSALPHSIQGSLSHPPVVARANQNLPRMGLDWSAPPGRAEFSPGLLPFTAWSKDDLAMMKRRHAVSLGGMRKDIRDEMMQDKHACLQMVCMAIHE